MMIDCILFNIIYPSSYFRFSRYLRPMKLAIESQTVLKTLKAIGKTIPQIIDAVLLMTIVNSLYAIIGNRLLPHDIPGITVRLLILNHIYSVKVTFQTFYMQVNQYTF